MNTEEATLQQRLKERFVELPKVVQDAITSADVQKRMRSLADSNKLHLDQWEALENEVMLALLGFQPAERLQDNIKEHVRVTPEVASELAGHISTIVFEPIREELERSLEHPEAKAEEVSGVEGMRTQILEATGQEENAPMTQEVSETSQQPPTTAEAGVAPAPVAPAEAPASPVPVVKAERAATTPSYVSHTPSAERKTIDGDPYREQVV